MIKVYEYGAAAPTENAALVGEQMHAAHLYYNTLIELEHRRRAAYDDLMAEHSEYQVLVDLAQALGESIETVRAQIKRARQLTRRLVDTAPLNAEVRALRELLASTRAEARLAKVGARTRSAAGVEALNAVHLERQKAARAACGVFWGSYLVVEDAVESARKKSLGPPRFKRWDGSGHLSVQIQHGMTVAEVFSERDTRFQMRAKDWQSMRAAGRRTVCRMRIGSNPDRSPVWTTAPVFYHRELPSDAVIKRVHLLRELLAGTERWKVQLTVETNEYVRVGPGHRTVGVDIGWRVVDEGLRVGYWCDSDGAHGQIVLDHTIMRALTKAQSLRAIRDKNMEAMRSELTVWIERDAPAVPPWFSEHGATIKQWRNANRYVHFLKLWNEARFDGDSEGFTVLAAWGLHDRHLWQWECHQRDKSLRRRREEYRKLAARMADKYAVLAIEGTDDEGGKMDLRPLAEQAPPEGEKDTQQTARFNRVLAATSILRTCLEQAFLSRHRAIRYPRAAYTTQKCSVCGVTFKRTADLMQLCTCGREWDQDRNAAQNLVAASGELPSSSGGPLAEDKASGSRWKRRKEAKAERENGEGLQGCSQSIQEVAATTGNLGGVVQCSAQEKNH